MRGLIYRLISRRNLILKSIIILSLLSLSSYIVVLLPQLATPHVLGKYLGNLIKGASDIEEEEPSLDIDFDVDVRSESPTFIDNFSLILEKSSAEAFNLYQPKSYYLFVKEYITITNKTIINGTHTGGFVIGLPNNLYDSLRNYSSNNGSLTGAIILSEFENDTTGIYSIICRNQNTTLTTNKIIDTNAFSTAFPNLNYYLNHLEPNLFRYFFIKVDELITLYDDIIKESDAPYYFLKGYISFNEFQKDIIYWSIDSPKRIGIFQEELIANIKYVDSTAIVVIEYNYYGEDAMFVNIVFSFIRGLQLLIWSISLILGIITIARIQRNNKDQELRLLFAGQKWFKRVITHLFECLIVILVSSSIALIVIYPFIKLQVLFGIRILLNTTIIPEFIIIPIILFFALFITFLDFEFYLRRSIHNQSREYQYKLFVKIPRYVKLIFPLFILLILWFLNKNLISLLAFILFLMIAGLICYLVTLLLRGILYIGKKVYYRHQRRNNKPLSSFYILLKLWQKRLSAKILLYSLILTLISAAFLFTNFTADAKRTEFMWWNGGEIGFYTPATNTSLINEILDANTQVNDYTKMIFYNQHSNESDHYSYALINDIITEVNSSYMGERIDHLIGINFTDYFRFYKSWNKKNWLMEGQLDSLTDNSIFVSQKVQDAGFGLDSTLNFINDSLILTTKGIIDSWPTITGQFGEFSKEQLIFIFNYELLHSFLISKNIEYMVRYKIHTDVEYIKSTADELKVQLLALNSVEEMSYLDSSVFEGLRKIFLEPIIIVAQILLLLWGALFIYTNFESVSLGSDGRNLGIIALTKDFKKPLIRFEIMEGFLLYSSFLFLFGILYVFSFSLLLGMGIVFAIKSIMISKYTIFNSLFLILFYLGLLIIQAVIEYFNLRKINLSMIYRHPE